MILKWLFITSLPAMLGIQTYGNSILSEDFSGSDIPTMKRKAEIVSFEDRKALQFAKNNEFATIDVGRSFPLLEGTVEFKLKLSRELKKDDPDFNVFSIVGTPRYWNRYQLYFASKKGRIFFNIGSDKYSVPNPWSADCFVTAPLNALQPGKWHRIDVSWANLNSGNNLSTIKLYIDGKLQQKRVGVITVTGTGTELVLGKDLITSMEAFPGALTDLVISDRDISLQEAEHGLFRKGQPNKLPELKTAVQPVVKENESLMTVYPTAVSPEIDGKISPGEWNAAAYTRGLIAIPGGEMLFPEALFRTMYDKDFLYVSMLGIFPGQKPAEMKGIFADSHCLRLLFQTTDGRIYEFGLDGNHVKRTRVIAMDGTATSCSMKWNGAISIVDSGEIGGSALTFSKSIWQAELAIPLNELGLDANPIGKIRKANFFVHYPHDKDSAAVSWAMTKKTSSAESGNLLFSSGTNLPKVFECDLARIVNGEIKLETKRNASDKPAFCYAEAIFIRPDDKSEFFHHSFPQNFPAGKAMTLESQADISFRKNEKLLLSCRLNDLITGNRIFQRGSMYAAATSFRVESLVLYSRELLKVDVDLRAYSPRPKQTSCRIELCDESDISRLSADANIPEQTGRITCDMDISKIKPGKYLLRVAIGDQGNNLGKIEKNISIHPKPEWWKNNIGKVTSLMKPWTPVKVDGDSVEIWNRRYSFRDLPFQSEIMVGGKALTDGPIELRIEEADGKVRWEKGRLEIKRTSELEADILCELPSKRIVLEGRSRVEFDGFTRIDWTLRPTAGKVTLKKMELVVPFNADNVLYMKGMAMEDWRSDNFGIYSACLYPTKIDPKYGDKLNVHKKWQFSAKGWIWPDKFCHDLWIGNDDAGVSFMFDSPVNWYTGKYITTATDGKRLDLIFNIIDRNYVLEAPVSWSMAIQATPVKPSPENPKAWRVGYRGGETPSESSKGMSLAVQYRLDRGPGWPKFTDRGRKIIDNWAKEGVRLTTPFYSNITTAEMPEYQIYGREWEIEPKISWSFGWEHGSGGTGVMVSLNGIYGDFYLYGANKLIDQGAKGIYIDSSAVLASTNPYTDSGYVDANGERKPTIGLFNTREVYKRLYNLFKTRVPDSVIWVHSTPITALASFADATCEGEEWTDFRRNENWKFDIGFLTPDFFRAGYMVYGYRGIPFLFYPGFPRGYPKEVSQADMLPICLAHNVFPIDYGYPLYAETWKVMNDWYTKSKWIPYWKNSNWVTSFADRVKIGVYGKEAEHKYLLLLANTDDQPHEGKIGINWKAFGLNPEQAHITAVGPDAVPGELNARNGSLDVKLPKLCCRFFLIEKK